jgi:mercuric ion binding protein
MKKLLFSLFAICLMSLAGSAQTKAQVTAKIKTPTVQCEMCKTKIEEYLNQVDGVQSAVVNVKKKETTVKYLTDRTNIEVIKAYIANAGYDADEVSANADAYKILPKCCKKPEGGTAKPNH